MFKGFFPFIFLIGCHYQEMRDDRGSAPSPSPAPVSLSELKQHGRKEGSPYVPKQIETNTKSLQRRNFYLVMNNDSYHTQFGTEGATLELAGKMDTIMRVVDVKAIQRNDAKINDSQVKAGQMHWEAKNEVEQQRRLLSLSELQKYIDLTSSNKKDPRQVAQAMGIEYTPGGLWFLGGDEKNGGDQLMVQDVLKLNEDGTLFHVK